MTRIENERKEDNRNWQLYDDDLTSSLKKHQVFTVIFTTFGHVHEDHAKAYRIGTALD